MTEKEVRWIRQYGCQKPIKQERKMEKKYEIIQKARVCTLSLSASALIGKQFTSNQNQK